MVKISIIGAAGTLGATIAFRLAANKKIDELCLIDINNNVLLNHLMDLQNAYPYKKIYNGMYMDLVNSDIVIITAGIPNRNDVSSRNAFLKDNLKLFKQFGENIQEYASDALIVTASNPVDILNYYLFEKFSFKPRQLIGYTMNDSYRFEWALRNVLEFSEEDKLYTPVIGEHGNLQVPVFSQLTKNGKPFEINVEIKKQVQTKLQSWFIEFNALQVNRTTGWTTARGMDKVINSLLSPEPFKIIGSTILNGAYGIEGVGMGAPLIVNHQGIQEVEKWDLTVEEQEAYQRAADTIRETMSNVLMA